MRTAVTLAVTAAAALGVVAARAALADPDPRDPSDARAADAHLHGCHRVHAMIIDSRTTDGCTSPYFCAAGLSYGNLGLNGSTYFTMDGIVKAPDPAGAGMAATTGILVYTTAHGTLTVRETGIGNMKADASSGIGSSFEQVQGGTGRYAGATGVLYLASEAGNGQFVAEVSGELCLP
jgi:hypothetical protein